MVVGTITESILLTTASLKLNNMPVVHLYSVIELFLLSVFFRFTIKEPTIRKRILPIGLAIVVMSILYAFTGNNLHTFNSLPRGVESVFIILLSVVLFFEMATMGDSKDPIYNATYWANGTIMFYFISCFVTFAFSRSIQTDNYHLRHMYDMHAAVNTFCNVLYSLSIWISYKSSSQVA